MELTKMYNARYKIKQIYKSNNMDELENTINDSFSKKDRKNISSINMDKSNYTVIINCNSDIDQKSFNNIIDTTKKTLYNFIINNKGEIDLPDLSTNLICDCYSVGKTITFLL